MPIENVLVEAHLASLFAVCCTTNLTLEAINSFLAQVWKAEQQGASDDEPPTHTFTVVHDLETHFWGATEKLQGEEPDKVLQSPFAGLDYPHIRELLVQMTQATGSKLKTDWFLVLDELSVETNSAVMVNVEPNSADPVEYLRVAYATASRDLAAVSIGHPTIGELKEVVDDNPDKFKGVLRDD